MALDELDREILAEFYLADNPVLITVQLTDAFSMTRQGIESRLKSLSNAGYLHTDKPSRDRFYWLTEEGEEVAKTVVREDHPR